MNEIMQAGREKPALASSVVTESVGEEDKILGTKESCTHGVIKKVNFQLKDIGFEEILSDSWILSSKSLITIGRRFGQFGKPIRTERSESTVDLRGTICL
ncbi:hypothetical protein UPYG_G00279810 [Umbra pygmaea]|uniref:Uncharacterized protein n=1 Tax=Umbra pygmaea TaxID=75934 RepID=A0ABD0W2Y1_UMBPY